MFCTECGTKLEDNAAFCTNCGHKIPAAASIAETVVEPVVEAEPVQAVEQPMYSQPSAQSMYSEPASQSMYSEPASQSMYSEPSSQMAGTTGAMYGASQGAYGTDQNMYGANQNTYAANASYNYNAQQPKKKGKGCLIAVIIASVVGIIGVLLVVLLVIFGASLLGGGSDSVEDIYGFWTGTSDLVSVSGEDEMQEYLEDLYGRPLTDSEIAGLSDGSYGDYFQIDIYEYEDENYDLYPGSWNMDLYMGSFFGTQNWDDWDALTYYEFDNDRSAGCIELDGSGRFKVDVTETDYLGEYGCVFFDSYDYDVEDYEVEEDGEYGITFSGQVTENASGDKQIEGEIVITFQYGDMSEPYVMEYEYILDDCSEY